MELNKFLFSLSVLFLPGIITLLFVQFFVLHKKLTPFNILLYSFLFGWINYFIYYVYTLIFKVKCFYFLKSLATGIQELNFSEILIVCLISIVLGIVLTYLLNYKIPYRIVNYIKMSKKIGPVWNYCMDAENSEWAFVRDLKNNLMYRGWINAFSDDSERLELLLLQVEVCNNTTGDIYYNTPSLYISGDRENITIEFPYLIEKNQKKENRKNGKRKK
jgi:hypothetical protein